jgi:hypothetical protein
VVASQSGLTHGQKVAMLQTFLSGAQPIINAPAPVAKSN